MCIDDSRDEGQYILQERYSVSKMLCRCYSHDYFMISSESRELQSKGQWDRQREHPDPGILGDRPALDS